MHISSHKCGACSTSSRGLGGSQPPSGVGGGVAVGVALWSSRWACPSGEAQENQQD